MRLYADSSKCSGCRACLVACSLHLFGENNPKKAALRVIPHFPAPGVFEVRVCTQCGDCAEVCASDAIHQNDKGAYFVDPQACDLSLACIKACPEGVVFVRDDVAYAWQCDLCGDCVPACGTSALWIAA